MKLTEICIKRPVLSTVMSMIIILVGIVTWSRLQVRQYPNVEQPKISVITQFDGASPEIVEAQVTKPLEDALSGIEGLDMITSRSEVEESRITLVFNLKRPIEAAANDVRDRIGRVRNKLPNDVSDPRIKKADADALPFMYLTLHSENHPVKELADYAFRYLESQIEVINGVSSSEIFGGGEIEMRLILDPVKLAGYKITAEDVANALKQQNVEKPAGRLITEFQEIVVTTKAPMTTEKQFNQLVVGDRNGYLVRLQDVGHAEMKSDETRNKVLFNGKPAVAIGIIKQSIANPLEIAHDVKKQIIQIQETLPKGMILEVANDRTTFIDRSIDNVYRTLFEATLLVILVILVFLRSFRAILIPIVAIPISLIGAFFIMYMFNFTINVLTLLALVLAIGLVVDDAIVMLENIYRYIERGMSPMAAAFKGAKEISFAVIAMTITLAAVYAPITLSPGMTGILFTEFALTLAGAVILSGFVALTISPMMCGRLLKEHSKAPVDPSDKFYTLKRAWRTFGTKGDVVLDHIDNRYAFYLRKALSHHWYILLIATVISGLGYYVVTKLPTELVPREDQGILNVRATPPYGANLKYTERYMRQVDDILKDVPEIEYRLTLITVPGESTALNTLTPWENRKRSSREIVESLRDSLYDITGLQVFPSMGGKSLIGGTSDTPVELVVQTTKSYNELIEMADNLMNVLSSYPALSEVQGDFSNEGQEYVVTIDRDKSAFLGVDIASVAQTLDTLISGRPASHFKRENKRYNVKVEVEEKFRKSPDDISGLYIRGTKDRKEAFIPLSEIITISKRTAPTEISHFGGLRSITLSAKLKPNYSLGETLNEVKKIAYETLPDGTRIDFSGESRRYLEETSNIYLIFGLAIFFIYMVLAAQYESFVDPLIILFSVPMSLASGVFLLWMVPDMSMNLYSQIGLLTLIGLITKHGILIVDFANKLKADGLNKIEAVIESSRLRLRPILMTTFAMVLGALPLALAAGAGMESRQPIGLVIVGGMTLGTLFTLFLVPAVYILLSSSKAAKDIHGFEH
ncbi:MAG: efflux RND transporter permease subunit [Candidatus Nucleicultricaceae bacterium]